MTDHSTSGARLHAALGFSPSASQRASARRGLALCVAAVVAMHLAVLTPRPGSAAGSVVPAAAVMLVRMVSVAPAAPSAAIASRQPPAPAAPETTPMPIAMPGRTPIPAVAEASPARTTAAARPPALPRSGGETARDSSPGPSDARPAALDTEAAVADAPLAAAPDYLLSTRLDPGPRPLDEIEPDYPDTVRLREGTVVLRLLISDVGHVDEVAVVRSEPRGVFEQAALDAFGKARFAPGILAGTPVKSQITVEVQFMPINRGARVSGRSY